MATSTLDFGALGKSQTSSGDLDLQTILNEAAITLDALGIDLGSLDTDLNDKEKRDAKESKSVLEKIVGALQQVTGSPVENALLDLINSLNTSKK